MSEELYYIQDKRQYVGNCVVWWGKNSSGYTTHLSEAGKYPKEKLKALRYTDVMWPVDLVDKAASLQVDMQRLHVDPASKPILDEAWKKKLEAEKPSPKLVRNCRTCGRVFHDDDPYQEDCRVCG